MAVGDPDYMYELSRIAIAFQSSASMEYLENQGINRINQLSAHTHKLSAEIDNGK